MDQVRLKCNTDKTELIQFGSRQQLHKIDTIIPLNADGDLIQVSNVVRYLGGYMDCNLNFKKHISQKIMKAMTNITRIRSIRKKIHLNGSLHDSNSHAVHMPSRLWNFYSTDYPKRQ